MTKKDNIKYNYIKLKFAIITYLFITIANFKTLGLTQIYALVFIQVFLINDVRFIHVFIYLSYKFMTHTCHTISYVFLQAYVKLYSETSVWPRFNIME